MTNAFDWKNKGPSIFADDPAFKLKSNGKTTSQMASEKVEQARAEGKMPGTIHGLGNDPDKYHKARENAIILRSARLNVRVPMPTTKGTP